MPEIAGNSYEDLIKEVLADERRRKSSLEQRGNFVITSSGALTTLLLGIAAFGSTTAGEAMLPLFSVVLLVIAVLLFALAAALALKINEPANYEESSVSGLQELVDEREHWSKDPSVGMRSAAKNRLEILGKARIRNEAKATLLKQALTAEVASIAMVAVSVTGLLASPA